MICVSLRETSPEAVLAALSGLKFAEVRLDGFLSTPDDAARIFSSHPNLVATMRPGARPEPERVEVLSAAIAAGAAYVDLELDSPSASQAVLREAAARNGCRVIVSHHDHLGTPPRPDLEAIREACFASGADLSKIACRIAAPRDCARLLGLLDFPRPVVAVGMGPLGRITRVAAVLLGAPFTFASRAEGLETAEGQLPLEELARLIGEISREQL